VLVYDRLGRGNRGGFGVQRGTTVAQTPWTYLRRGDMGARDVARRRVDLDGRSVQQVHLVDSPHARLTRDFAVTEAPASVGRALPRNASTRAGISDTVPEMRSDRRDATPRGAHPTDMRSQRRLDDAPDAAAVPRRSRPSEAEARTPGRPVRERDGGSQADREVLRPMFRPLSRTRPDGRDGGPPADAPRPRNESEARPHNDGEARPRNDGESRRGNDGEARRGGDGESRRGGGDPHPSGASRESNPRPAPPPRHEAEAQPRHQPPPPPAAAARRPRKEQ
jgi:hypothetical protein